MTSGKLMGVTPPDAGPPQQVLRLSNLSRFHKLNVAVRADAEIHLIEKEPCKEEGEKLC